MDWSTANCYSCDWDSYPCRQVQIPHDLTNWAISTPWKHLHTFGWVALVWDVNKVTDLVLFVMHLKRGVTGCLLEFSVPAKSKIISRWPQTCDSKHSWSLYSAASLWNQAWYPIQLHYPDTELISQAIKWQVSILYVHGLTRLDLKANPWSVPIRPSHPVPRSDWW